MSPVSVPCSSTSGSFLIFRATMIRSASSTAIGPRCTTSRSTGVIRSETGTAGSTNRTSRSDSRPSSRRPPPTTTSVPTPDRCIRARASLRGAQAGIAYGSAMIPCWVRLTISTSRTCGSMSPSRKPRSMTPRPPSSASTIAISARVTVSMFADTIGRASVRCSDSRQDRSMFDGSRRSITDRRGANKKSSNVAPRASSVRYMALSAQKCEDGAPRVDTPHLQVSAVRRRFPTVPNEDQRRFTPAFSWSVSRHYTCDRFPAPFCCYC